MNSGIYRITVGSRFYYGSSIDVSKRENQHRRELEQGTHHNVRLQNAWNRHKDFNFNVVEFGAPDELLAMEQKYLDEFFGHDLCVNLTPTAGSPKGYKHTPEAIQKMQVAMIGKQHTAETKARMSKSHSGMQHSEETKARMRKPKSEQHAARCRENGKKGGRRSSN